MIRSPRRVPESKATGCRRSPRRDSMTMPLERNSRLSLASLAFITLLGLAALWAYWTTLGVLVERWGFDPQYSHGYLVPAFAGYLLWLRRDRLAGHTLSVNGLGIGL